ncbi:MAG: GTP cyclohydrolase II, partial [Woeseiaceae bacterium]|nr:GTP cyclohydrolase II [Woeseiaceae bacterium]
MFTYIDPTVRERLVAAGKLNRIDSDGRQIALDAEASPGSISILGPIPLPLNLGGRRYEADWYACVRNTELSRIQEIADQLRALDAQESFASLASSMAVNSVLVVGDRARWTNPLV